MAVAHEHYRAVDGVVARAVGDEMVLLDLRSGVYYSLNAVGAIVWQGIDRSASLEQIVADTVSEFEVDAETAREDVRGFLRSAAEAGLIAEV